MDSVKHIALSAAFAEGEALAMKRPGAPQGQQIEASGGFKRGREGSMQKRRLPSNVRPGGLDAKKRYRNIW
jgi:hypothetical protein